MEVTVRLSGDLGDLRLGKLSQKYVTDPEIRSLLSNTALDVKKMEPYDQNKLLLITSVIYSEKNRGDKIKKRRGIYSTKA